MVEENQEEKEENQEIEEEIWNEIENHEGKYWISNLGNIKNIHKKLKPYVSGSYYGIKLVDGKDRDSVLIHRLVASYFVENEKPDEYNVVDHIDNNKLNNRYDNLRWTTQSGNMQSFADNHYKRKYRKIIQMNLKHKPIKIWNSIKEILEENKEYGYFYLMKRLMQDKICYNYYWKYEEQENDENTLKKDEIFKNIGIFEDHDLSKYKISNYGKIRNEKNNRFVKPLIMSGYICVHLYNQNKEYINFKAHRLVAHVFVKGKTEEKNVVNHLDENRTNNYYKNLKWVTKKENTVYSCGKKVQQIDPKTNKIINTFDSVTEAHKSVGVEKDYNISKCCRGILNLAYDYKWKFLE